MAAAFAVLTKRELREDERESIVEVLREKLHLFRVWKELPFATSFAQGFTHTHLVNEGPPVVSENRIISRGETLCKRRGVLFSTQKFLPPCQGCEVLAQNIALAHSDLLD